VIGEIVSAKVSNGDIILMHDYTSGKNTTCDALEIIIPDLLSRGYEFVTVSELLTQS
jgi:peptidoglycan/xylan/chitin deacetylase (PgdA/CDA1 family)